VNEILITVEAKEETEVALNLNYLVRGANWTPCYDVRVTTGEKTLCLVYYGTIYNNSDEDWINTNLLLSTAKPSVDGAPPTLYTSFVSVKPKYNYNSYEKMSVKKSVSLFSGSRSNSFKAQDKSDYHLEQDVKHQTTSVSESITCSTFEIPREATILSDNKPHKVTITNLEFETRFSYTIIPKLSTDAFLKASAMNTNTKYPLLAGEMNVFMDNNFVTKSSIPNVSQSESFSFYLGVDNAIKVDYKPVKNMTETSGIIKKTSTTTTELTTVITNNKNSTIKITSFDQLPKSDTSNIRVKLLEPEMNDDVKNISTTDENNIKWKYRLKAGEKKTIIFRYSIDFPADKEIDVN